MGGIVSGGTSRQATTQDLELYEQMRQQQAQQPVPVLQHRDNPHEYVFVALFDGTRQDVNNPKQLPTNIGELWKQAYELKRDPTNRIGAHYLPGIGTQKNPITRTIDGAVAYTWDEKIEEMYRALAEQTWQWQQQDPQAQVRLAEVGYSRGAVLVPGLARLIDQHGIMHPDDLKFGRDAHGNLTVESSRTLIPPGQVAQAVGLFDPVATNMPRNYDARLPPSVLSGFSLLARDEQRELFPHQTIIEPQMSHDRRFLGVPVPGGHANVGGGNRETGLEVMAFNGMADYLNALTDRPLFEHRPVPADPAQYTVHQAMGATAAFGLKMDHDGERNLRAELANCRIVDPCRDSEPMNRELANQFEYRRGAVDPAEQAQLHALIERTPGRAQEAPRIGEQPSEPARPKFEPMGNPLIDRFFDAHHSGDRKGMSSALIEFRESDRGQELMAEAREMARAERERQLPQGHDHPLYAQALQHVEKLGPRAGGFNSQEELERVAGAVALQAKLDRMPSIDAIVPSTDGKGLIATWTNPGNDMHMKHAYVDKTQAAVQPVEQNLQQLVVETRQQDQQAQIQAQQQATQSQGMSR